MANCGASRASGGVRRIAVTGASGYLGRLLIASLERRPAVERILALDIRPPRAPFSPKVAFVQCDVTKPLRDLFADHSIDAIAHLAFRIKPDRDRDAAHAVNIGGLANALDACGNAGVGRILYLSSATLYGAHPDNPPYLTETSPLRPVSGFQYAEDKIQAETLLAEYAARHPEVSVAILRACPILGATADNFIAESFTRRALVAIKGCDPPLQFLHERDAARIIADCLFKGVHGIYNVAGRDRIRWNEMAEIAGRRLIRLPAPLLYRLTALSWTLRLQSNSPACGLDFIRYPWLVSARKLAEEHGIVAEYTSREAWRAFISERASR